MKRAILSSKTRFKKPIGNIHFGKIILVLFLVLVQVLTVNSNKVEASGHTIGQIVKAKEMTIGAIFEDPMSGVGEFTVIAQNHYGVDTTTIWANFVTRPIRLNIQYNGYANLTPIYAEIDRIAGILSTNFKNSLVGYRKLYPLTPMEYNGRTEGFDTYYGGINQATGKSMIPNAVTYGNIGIQHELAGTLRDGFKGFIVSVDTSGNMQFSDVPFGEIRQNNIFRPFGNLQGNTNVKYIGNNKYVLEVPTTNIKTVGELANGSIINDAFTSWLKVRNEADGYSLMCAEQLLEYIDSTANMSYEWRIDETSIFKKSTHKIILANTKKFSDRLPTYSGFIANSPLYVPSLMELGITPILGGVTKNDGDFGILSSIMGPSGYYFATRTMVGVRNVWIYNYTSQSDMAYNNGWRRYRYLMQLKSDVQVVEIPGQTGRYAVVNLAEYNSVPTITNSTSGGVILGENSYFSKVNQA